VKKQSGGIFRLFLFLLLCSQTSFSSAITCENNIFVFIHKAFTKDIPPEQERVCERERERTMSGVTTRAQKRRIGERDLWSMIVKNDDICFQHILPRLNGTDLKFLYEVNTETRKLIKRSSRASDLKKWFQVSEMSSIATLEVAWEHKPLWPSWLDERHFCLEVAQTNKLELLKWAREEKKCKWNQWTINAAAYQGNLEMVKYCILEYLVERKYDQFDECACWHAAREGHLDCLKYLRETAKAPWDEFTVREAHENKHPECLQYCLDNNCPLPDGWSYVNGEFHVPDH
jgi:hypothetical protein